MLRSNSVQKSFYQKYYKRNRPLRLLIIGCLQISAEVVFLLPICVIIVWMIQMDKKEFPKRKRLRLENFDYSSSGAYFITICTKDRKMLFAPVGADSISARMVERTFLETIQQYDGFDSPIYVVMPNHFHAIITISRADMESAPTVSEIVQTFKRYSTVEYTKMVKDGILPPFDKQMW